MKILMVLTSHGKLGETDKRTGFWLEEFAAPYYAFTDAGAVVTLASPKGGQPPVDPMSTAEEAATEATRRYEMDSDLQQKLHNTKKLQFVTADDYDAVFFPGGHGPLWDLANDLDAIGLIETFWEQGKPIALVCHGLAALANVEVDEKPLVRGRNVTGFANTEEEAVGMTELVPFLIQDKMNQLGANYSKGDDWSPYVMVDGNLITGQNPASSGPAAQELLRKLPG